MPHTSSWRNGNDIRRRNAYQDSYEENNQKAVPQAYAKAEGTNNARCKPEIISTLHISILRCKPRFQTEELTEEDSTLMY